MANDTQFFNHLKKEVGLHLFVAAPARVITMNANGTADIKILFKTKDKDGELSDHPPVVEVPILKHIGELITGDVVWVNFADRALDHMTGAHTFDPGFTRVHSINDAVIVGVFK
ncbi:Gp138 family membrane-puncturing spike protein [Mesobacillus zeae]|uniref:Uncharacterized protein n=1 Tax=Mesobacillus zeae TaxID=1917180 RepID=A0A398B524_9BACI|nr:Gp138 family membrane-puncturing spike protein [Mesobacillus zeae]RID85015.1 hypothetical protein D1970_10635 [Mesobacillus zeae]